MYRQEFEAIWSAQQRFYPQLLTDKLRHGSRGKQAFPAEPDPPTKGKDGQTALERYGLEGIIYFQRPTYWPKSAVGMCELEPKHRRCPRADRLAQKARVYQEINNLEVDDDGDTRPLEPHEREKLIAFLFDRKDATFDQVRKHLGFLESVRFNLEAFTKEGATTGGRKKIKGLPTDAELAKETRFGKKGWAKLTEDQKDTIVDELLAFHYGYKTDCGRGVKVEEQQLFLRLTEDFGLDAEQADNVIGCFDDLPTGHGRLSRKALRYGGKEGRCGIVQALAEGKKMMCSPGDGDDDAIHAAGYLRPDERPPDLRTTLPGPGEKGWPNLPNPLVRQALHEVRKVVNAVVREHGCPDVIRIEMARDVKGSLEKRKEARFKQLEQTQRRDDAADRIREYGFRPSRESINRYLLWEEQGGIGIYSGLPISPTQLLNGDTDVDHILPRSRSLDNSMANKVVDFLEPNRRKGNRTPWEWLERDGDPDYSFEKVMQRARSIPHRGKQKKLAKQNVELDDFINRQLNDTAYIARAVVQYLKQLGRATEPGGELQRVHVVGTRGLSTATLRHHWGLNGVLHDTGFHGKKNRDDHRHHAVDAVVIALTDEKMLKQLSEGYEDVPDIDRETGEMEWRTGYRGVQIDPPWEDFFNTVEDAINKVHVSHRTRRAVAGALHEETLYGKTEEASVYVSRKPIETLTANEVGRIRDNAVRRKIEDRLREHGVDPGRGKGAIPKGVWKQPLWMNEEKGVQIKKVRVTKAEESVVPIRGGADNYHNPATPNLPAKRTGGDARAGGGAYIKTGANHHFEVFETRDKKGKPKYTFRNVTVLEAARRKRNHQPIIQTHPPEDTKARFVCSLSPGDSMMVRDPESGEDRVLVITSLISTRGQMDVLDANDARPSNTRDLKRTAVNTLFGKWRAKKVDVDPLGRLRNAERRQPAESAPSDPDIAKLAADRVAGRVSERNLKQRLAALGKSHMGAQLTAEIHRLKQHV